MTKKQKRTLVSVVFGLLLAFLMMVLIVPLITVDPIIDGVEATAWQNMHKFFLDTRTFLIDYWFLVFGLGAVGYGLVKVLPLKKRK